MEKDEVEEQLKVEISKPSSLHISRVPKNTLMRFYELASEEEFCNDYGLALRECVSSYYELKKLKGLIYSKNFRVVFEND